MRNYAERFQATNVNVNILALWHSAFPVLEIGNCTVFFRRFTQK